MLLPPHLMDYVLLHELTHTIEMNHGPKFWEILDGLTEGRAHTLRAELRQFRTSF
jgi:predicted metal-dependent hydrolase